MCPRLRGPVRTCATQPSSWWMRAVSAPIWAIVPTAAAMSSSSPNSWPTISSASRTFGLTTPGSAASAARRAGPEALTAVIIFTRRSSRRRVS